MLHLLGVIQTQPRKFAPNSTGEGQRWVLQHVPQPGGTPERVGGGDLGQRHNRWGGDVQQRRLEGHLLEHDQRLQVQRLMELRLGDPEVVTWVES